MGRYWSFQAFGSASASPLWVTPCPKHVRLHQSSAACSLFFGVSIALNSILLWCAQLKSAGTTSEEPDHVKRACLCALANSISNPEGIEGQGCVQAVLMSCIVSFRFAGRDIGFGRENAVDNGSAHAASGFGGPDTPPLGARDGGANLTEQDRAAPQRRLPQRGPADGASRRGPQTARISEMERGRHSWAVGENVRSGLRDAAFGQGRDAQPGGLERVRRDHLEAGGRRDAESASLGSVRGGPLQAGGEGGAQAAPHERGAAQGRGPGAVQADALPPPAVLVCFGPRGIVFADCKELKKKSKIFWCWCYVDE
jgi:hypothetical protein